MQPRNDGAPWWWAGPQTADLLGAASGNIKILSSVIPFFSAPLPGGRRLSTKAVPGSVYPVVDQRVAGEDTWVQVRPGSFRPQDPAPWIVARSGSSQYAAPTSEAPREREDTRRTSSGWPTSAAPFAPGGKCTRLADTSPLKLVQVQIPVRSGYKAVIEVAEMAAPVFTELIRWFDEEIEPVKSVGSYCHRPIRGYEGANKPSHHASGTAIDINADKHPLGAWNTFSPAQQAKIRAKIPELGLAWGGDWTKRPDDMHFEVRLDPVAFRALHERRGLKLEEPVNVEGPPALSRGIASFRTLMPGGEPESTQALRWKEYGGLALKVGGAAMALAFGGALMIKAVRSRRAGAYPGASQP
jgi:hypothetical protein